MSRELFSRTEKAWIRLSMPVNHAETTFRLLLRAEIKDNIERNLNVNDILTGAIDAKIITQSESDAIYSLPSNSSRLTAFLENAHARSGPGTLEIFLDCLRTEKYDHAAMVIHDHLQQIYKAATNSRRQMQIRCGLVPAQPEFYVARRELVYRFKDHIIAASDRFCDSSNPSTQWIVLHGMPGNGKSYLAAAALRSPEIWKVCFGDGVFWLDIGKPGTEKLLIKLGVLYQMVACRGAGAGTILPDSFTQPSDVETIQARLANAFATQVPHSALVLDDVWDESVIKAFEKIGCKCIIVTSRKKDIVKSMKTTVTTIEVNSGFTQSETEEYFAQILGKAVEQLPKEAGLIHHEANGSPMVVALIGGMLRDHNKPHEWRHYLSKLAQTPQSVMEMTGSTPYEYCSISEAISLSIESLKDDLKKRFFDFAIFDDDVPIPLSVFATLWSIPSLDDTADEMAYFVNSSLCTRDYCPQRDCYIYRFHDLILLYARNNIPVIITKEMTERDVQVVRERALVDKHRRLFFKYHEACKGRFQDLKDDYYIHNFIGYHLSSGKLMSDIKQLYDIKNKEFLEQRLTYAGPEVVLVDVLLLMKQHPGFKDQLKELENLLRERYAVNLNSPDVYPNRRSVIYEEFIAQSRRGSLAELDSSKFSFSDSEPGNSPAARSISQSSERPFRCLNEVQSEPILRSAPSLSRLGMTTHSASGLENSGSKENGRPHFIPEVLPTLPKLKMADLRNDNFDE